MRDPDQNRRCHPWRARRAIPAAIALLTFFALALSGESNAETLLLERQVLPLRVGSTYSFSVEGIRGQAASYTTDVQVLTVGTGSEGHVESTRFAWRSHSAAKRPKFDVKGHVSTSGLGTGRTLNPWLQSGKDVSTGDTIVWLSREACLELDATGQTRFTIDSRYRQRGPMLLRKRGQRMTRVTINGIDQQVEAIELTSLAGDRLLMLDECNNPLVLQAELPELLSWRLVSVRLP